MAELTQLSDDTVLLRTLTRAVEFRDGQPLLPAFYRRRRDEDGISFNYNVAVPDGCGTDLTGHRAILALSAGSVRTTPYGLDALADSPTHGVITGAPYCDDLDKEQLRDQIAARLIELSDIVWKKPASKQ